MGPQVRRQLASVLLSLLEEAGEREERAASARSAWCGGTVPYLDSEVVADALIGAFATEYRCELPGDAEVLERIGRYDSDALENLVAVGAVPPSDVLPVGLAILSAPAQLCRSGSASVFQLTA